MSGSTSNSLESELCRACQWMGTGLPEQGTISGRRRASRGAFAAPLGRQDVERIEARMGHGEQAVLCMPPAQNTDFDLDVADDALCIQVCTA